MLTEKELEVALAGLATTDPVLTAAANDARRALAAWPMEKRPELHVVDLSGVDEHPPPIYFTPNCVALPLGPTIVINERYLLEIEGAIRAFGSFPRLSHCPYALEERDMFALARRLQDRLKGYGGRLRRMDAAEGRDETMGRRLSLVTTFLVAHEYGHLTEGESGSFGGYFDPEALEDQKLGPAVVKACRHLDEFRTHGFSLDGEQGEGDTEAAIRSQERRLRADDFERSVRWFAAESQADAVAAERVCELLESEPVSASHDFIAAIFAASMLDWFRELMHLADGFGIRPYSHQELAIVMTANKRNYVTAASLFGDYHRFMLLRAVLALEAIEDRIPAVFDQDTAQSEAGREAVFEAWARYMLLRRIMDTGVKFATMGCATGWLLELEREQGAKPFLMHFYPLRWEMEQIYRTELPRF